MIKKKYMQPALEVSQAEAEEIIAMSISDIQSDGLDDDKLKISGDDLEGDPWEDAY